MTLKEPSPNELILNLFEKFSLYTDRFKDRIKIDSIFSELNENTRKKFNKFIELSQSRYKGVKNGNSLESFLLKQKPKYFQLSNNILNDIYFKSNDIDIENKKLFKKINKKNVYEITKFRNEIISNSKDLTNNERKLRDKLEMKIKQKRVSERKDHNSKINNIDEINSQIDKNKINNDVLDFKNLKDNLKLSQKNLLDTIVNEDVKQLNKSINDYKTYLHKINLSDNKINILKKQNFSFSKDNINLLSYKDIKKLSNYHTKEKECKIDIRKLMKYTKRGKSASKVYHKVLKNINNKSNTDFLNKTYNNKNILPNNELLKLKLKQKSNKILTPSSTTTSIFSLENNYNNSINNNFNSSTDFSNYKNTKNLLKNEAEKVKFIGENFDKKWNNMENLLSKINLPNLKSSKSKKISSNKKEVKEDKHILNDLHRKDQYTLYLDFNKVYEKKKKEWEIEDEKIKLEKEKEKEIYDNTQNYLKEIQNLQRKPQLYIDSYSKRDGIVNKKIELFNQLLNRSFFNKKNLEKKLIDFNEKIEIHEAERKLYEKQLEEKILEKKKTKESILEKEIVEKLKQNLKNSKENTFEFNYEVVGQKVKKNNKDNAYKEYLDFFRNIINKDYNSQKNEKTIKIKKLQKSNSQENINSKVLHLKKLLKYKKNLKEENEESNNTKLIVIESQE